MLRDPTQQLVRELFDYSDNGSLSWKIKRPITGCLHRTGYWIIAIKRKLYSAHRLIWIWHYGAIDSFIDHIDGDKLNNKIENLRPATISQNGANRKMQKNNTTGFKGVVKRLDSNGQVKYNAYISRNRYQKNLGTFLSPEAASEAYKNAANFLFGEFARV